MFKLLAFVASASPAAPPPYNNPRNSRSSASVTPGRKDHTVQLQLLKQCGDLFGGSLVRGEEKVFKEEGSVDNPEANFSSSLGNIHQGREKTLHLPANGWVFQRIESQAFEGSGKSL